MGKITSPAKRREAVKKAQELFGVSERRACRAIQQVRATQRYTPLVKNGEEALRRATVKLASKYGRYGYRRITVLQRPEGWQVNHKRWSVFGAKKV